jgi:hypothetical protein
VLKISFLVHFWEARTFLVCWQNNNALVFEMLSFSGLFVIPDSEKWKIYPEFPHFEYFSEGCLISKLFNCETFLSDVPLIQIIG